MKYLYAFFLLFTSVALNAQNWDTTSFCHPDTLTIEQPVTIKVITGKIGADTTYPYLALRCSTTARIGWRFDVGVCNYIYNGATADWLGNHGGPNFSPAFFFHNVTVGVRFKPWTITPQTDLEFDGVLLTDQANLNPIKVEYFAGYTINLFRNVTFEPYVGYSRNSFHVINEDELGQSYDLDLTPGLALGGTIHKYFKLDRTVFMAITLGGGYNTADFSKTHPSLGQGYSEWNVGVAFKGAATRNYLKWVGRP